MGYYVATISVGYVCSFYLGCRNVGSDREDCNNKERKRMRSMVVVLELLYC